jgi:hypothetical protein
MSASYSVATGLRPELIWLISFAKNSGSSMAVAKSSEAAVLKRCGSWKPMAGLRCRQPA